MRLIGLTVVLALGLTFEPLVSEAQQAGRMYQVGYVTLGSQPTQSGLWRSFLDAMRELNYEEGRNLVVRLAFAEGRPEHLPGLIADLIQAKVDVIVTTATQETMAANRATSTIPIVMTVAPDPVEQGLVASLAHPGGNVTGLTSMAPGTSQKLVELLREAVPSASRFAVVGTPGSNPEIRRELQTAAQQSRVTLSFIEIRPSREPRRTVREGSSLLSVPSPTRTGQNWCNSPSSISCPGSIGSATMWRRAVSCRMAPTSATWADGPHTSSIGSSRGPSPPTCPWSSPPISSWSSIAGRPRRFD